MADPAPILALIRKHESDGATSAQGVGSPFNVVWGGIPRQNRPQQPLTTCTVDEVQAWQRWVVGQGSASSAAGAYQFIRATLVSIEDDGAIHGDETFTEEVQDRAAIHLLKRRGWDKLVAGQITREAFADNLAREWASLPVHSDQRGQSRFVTRGSSYYAGDALNKAHARPEEVMEAISAALGADAAPPPPRPAVEAPADLASVLSRLEALEAWRAEMGQACRGE